MNFGNNSNNNNHNQYRPIYSLDAFAHNASRIGQGKIVYPSYTKYNNHFANDTTFKKLQHVYLPPQRRNPFEFVRPMHLQQQQRDFYYGINLTTPTPISPSFSHYAINAAAAAKHEFIPFKLQEIHLGSQNMLPYSKNPDDCANLQYRYLNGVIAVAMHQNSVKFYIPLDAIHEIHQIGSDTLVLCLDRDKKKLIQHKILDVVQNRQNFITIIESASTMRFVAENKTPIEKIALTKLHVEFEINKIRESQSTSSSSAENDHNDTNSIFSGEGEDSGNNTHKTNTAYKTASRNILIKFHYNWKSNDKKEEDIRVFPLEYSTSFDKMKSLIQESYEIHEIKEMACRLKSKHSNNRTSSHELFLIRDELNWRTAMSMHSDSDRLELWFME
ncbi:12601_t:CDS:2 [Ambispora gerdemannii]|uniref:12601_t:CDS:1 n=1 Tax=Ambispora gerdemannii TaxID=144530 RepID=A0A9N9C6Y6_9GLOM|nr:12601_t:CDS:2 [Ambispora gerdemannii]